MFGIVRMTYEGQQAKNVTYRTYAMQNQMARGHGLLMHTYEVTLALGEPKWPKKGAKNPRNRNKDEKSTNKRS